MKLNIPFELLVSRDSDQSMEGIPLKLTSMTTDSRQPWHPIDLLEEDGLEAKN